MIITSGISDQLVSRLLILGCVMFVRFFVLDFFLFLPSTQLGKFLTEVVKDVKVAWKCDWKTSLGAV